MIIYDPLWRTLKEKNISTYKLEHEYRISKSMIFKLRHNKSITMNTLNELCRMFDCDIPDVIEYLKE
ncbi:MAG: helix-turn-helix transcriptional regulator [Lachnospiraceae bacterium]|nr:helix-turn-helix transcriptional regulator [Lachnospiraceae bacterium]